MTTYQRLKKENTQLKKELYILANFPNYTEGALIKTTWALKKQIEDALMAGDPTKTQKTT